MCGRFTLHTSGDVVARHFDIHPAPSLKARYNVAPSQIVATVGARSNGVRGLGLMAWGLVPRWAAKSDGMRPINARSETIREKPTFRECFDLAAASSRRTASSSGRPSAARNCPSTSDCGMAA